MEDFFRKIVLSKEINDIWVELEIDIDKDLNLVSIISVL